MPEVGHQLGRQKAGKPLPSDFPVAVPVIVTRITAWFLPRKSWEDCLLVFCWLTGLAFPGFCCLRGYEVIFLAASLAALAEAAGSFPASFRSSKGQCEVPAFLGLFLTAQ